MNGEPVPIEHGAPVRLRIETQLGVKMVGCWREDQQYYASAAGI